MNLLVFSLMLLSLTGTEHGFSNHDDVNKLNGTASFDTSFNDVKKRLPVYHASLCIEDLLKQIVKANRKYYDPKQYFYSLSFKKDGEKRYLVIETSKYKSSRALDYGGVIKIYSSIFLCRGDIAIDTLFKSDRNAFLTVYLGEQKESDDFNYGVEPTLRGLYEDCRGVKINLEIYTRARLPGYKTKEPNTKKQST